MEAVVSPLIMLKLYIVLSVQFPLRYHFSRASKFIICGSDPKMCIHIDNEYQQEVFQISYPQFV